MIVQCEKCKKFFEDVFRLMTCPHETFMANDGFNKLEHHPISYLSDVEPPKHRIFESHK